jgi:hypothetical protein
MIPTPRCMRDEVPPLFRAMFWVVPHPFFPAYHCTHSPNQSPIGLFRPLKWAVHSLPRARELLRAGVGILGEGHTPHSGSALAPWSVLPMGCTLHAGQARGGPLTQGGLRHPG